MNPLNETPAENSPASADVSATGLAGGTPDLAQLALEQSQRTTASFAGETNKGGRPKGSKDKSKRKSKIPVEFMGNGTGETPFESGEAGGSETTGDSAADSVASEEIAAIVVEGCLEGYKAIRADMLEMFAFKVTGNSEFSKNFPRPIPEKLDSVMQRGGEILAKFYAEQLKVSPWAMLLGPMAIISGGDWLKCKRLAADAKKAREQNQSAQ